MMNFYFLKWVQETKKCMDQCGIEANLQFLQTLYKYGILNTEFLSFLFSSFIIQTNVHMEYMCYR